MADDRKIEIFGVMVSEKDAEEFLRSMHIRPCEACTNEEWEITLNPPSSDEYLAIWTAQKQSELGANHLPVYTCACTKCGYIRSFLTYHLTQWVQRRNAKNG